VIFAAKMSEIFTTNLTFSNKRMNSKRISIASLILLLGILAATQMMTSSASTPTWGPSGANVPIVNGISAGYFMTATPGTVQWVHTEIYVPTVLCGPSETTGAVQIAGIDRPPTTNEAVGIAFGCTSGIPFYTGFYVIADTPVSYGTVYPGDHIKGTISVDVATQGVTVLLQDVTKGHAWSATFTGTDTLLTGTQFSWNLVLFPGPTLPIFGTIRTIDDFAILSGGHHSIGYWSVNPAVTTDYVTMQFSGTTIAYPTFINSRDEGFKIIQVTLV
jgi:hypothetical protein